MEEKVIIVNPDGTTNEKETVKEELKAKLKGILNIGKKAVTDAYTFTTENKENVMFLIGLGATAATAINKVRNRTYSDRYRVENSVYDPVTHTRFWLRRPLTNAEQIEYLRRTRNGEYADEVLESMGVLRR